MYVYLYYFELLFTTAGDISGAVQTLRTLLLFYPTDKDSLDNLQLYSETLGGATEAQGTHPKQVTLSGIKFTTKAVIMQNHNIHVIVICLPLVMPLTLLCGFVLQEIVSYISQSLQEKKLLYFGMESLDFNFIDPVSIEPVVSFAP